MTTLVKTHPRHLLIHLVPKPPSVICGVGDYSTLVGRKIEHLYPNVQCGYVACGRASAANSSQEAGRRDATGCNATGLWRAVGELIEELNGDADSLTIVIHYSGWSYDRNGAPAWLAAALERRPPGFFGAKLITMFHEFYAAGWPWRRAFWSYLRQRNVVIRLARLSDELMTSRQQSARWLDRVTGRATGAVASLPIPSTIGEPHEVVPWEDRSARAVLFGGARFKRPFLRGRGAQSTAELCQKLEIRTLVNIGAPADVDRTIFQRNGVEMIDMGYLPAHDVSAELSAARLALADYFSAYYAKSSVLAAMAAHGTPIIFPRRGRASDGLRFGKHLWDLRSARAAMPDEARVRLSSLAQAAHAWYEGHNLERHANLLSRFVARDADWEHSPTFVAVKNASPRH